MKRTICLILLCATVFAAQASTRRALVIGIGAYPKEGGWPAINGDKDVPVVEGMLLTNGFQKKDIIELTNIHATHAGIQNAFATLISKAQTGDIIYIHFSGHGQQVTDLNGDEEDGYDEAWIPYDAHLKYQKGVYEGQNHILDDELNTWVNKLKAKVGTSGKIIVVADACHSGEGNRSEEEENTGFVVRGTSDAFVIPGTHKAYSGSTKPTNWIFISACKPHQSNYEYHGNGSLTYALKQQASALGTLSCSALQKKIRETIQDVIPFTQLPMIEMNGSTSQKLF